MIEIDAISPADLADQLGWSERRVRYLARRLGACRVLGNRMILLGEDVAVIFTALVDIRWRYTFRRGFK